MEKNVISVDENYLVAGVNEGVCPLDWLAQFYKDYPGKLVMLDEKLMSYLLNMSSSDFIKMSEHDGYKQTFDIVWKATENYPETEVVIGSYGKDEITKQADGEYLVYRGNYFVIEKLKAEDILVNNREYANNMKTDKQITLLTINRKKANKR